MAAVAELTTCDGFTVEAPEGRLGWVEETWLDAESRPGALAVRTPDGRRALLLADDVRAVDLDAQEVFAGGNGALLALEPPRLTSAAGTIAATWRATGVQLRPAPAGADAASPIPSLDAVRATTARHEPPLLRTVAIGLSGLVTLVGLLIGLDYLIAYLVSGHPY